MFHHDLDYGCLGPVNLMSSASSRRRVRVLHLITDLDTGGAEHMLTRLVRQTNTTLFENIVVSMMPDGALCSEVERAGANVLTLGMRRGIPNPLGLFRLSRLLHDWKPDILQTWLYHADLMGLVAGRLARVPRIAWNVRCSNMEMSNYSKLSMLVLRTLAQLSRVVDVVVVNSKTGQRAHESIGYRPRRWCHIPNGLDLEQFQPDTQARMRIREEIGVSDGAVLIGLVARYDPMKDHVSFLRAAGILAKAYKDVSFMLVGRGVDIDNTILSTEIARQGIEGRVHRLGERSDIPAVVVALDIATSSSAFGEGFSNVIGEAMACSVPCVVTDVGDSRLLVGDTGKVVPPKDPDALADGWRALIEIGAEGRASLGSKARHRIQTHYSLPDIVGQYEDLYMGLAD